MNEKIAFDFSFIILSAGYGKRMNSDIPKGAMLLKNKPFVLHIVDTLEELGAEDIITVVGYKKDVIIDILKDRVRYAYQEKQLGTADAVRSALCYLNRNKKSIIIPGDIPLITKDMIIKLIDFHMNNNNDFTILSFNQDEELYYGRIIRENNKVREIKEYKELSLEEIDIKEVNSGIYITDNNILFDYLKNINNDNNQREFYFTDIISEIVNSKKVDALVFETSYNLIGINDQKMLKYIESRIS